METRAATLPFYLLTICFIVVCVNTKIYSADSLNVSLIGNWDVAAGEDLCRGLAVNLDTAYFGADSKIQIIDFTDPADPELLSSPSFNPHCITMATVLKDNYLYIADSLHSLRIAYIDDPTLPEQIGYLNLTDVGWGVDVDGSYCFFIGGYTFHIIDISIPDSPTLVSSLNLNNFSYDIEVLNDYCYIAGGSGGLKIIDISDVNSPFLSSSLDTDGSARRLSVKNGFCYLADETDGMRIIDINDASNPFEVGYFTSGNRTYDVAIDNDFAYIADRINGLRIVNVSDLTNIYEVGYYEKPSNEIQFSENHIYVASYYEGLFVFEFYPPAFTDINLLAVETPLYFNEEETGDGHDVEMLFTSAIGAGNVTVDQFNCAYPDTPADDASDYYWNINHSKNISDFMTNISFHYTDIDVSDFSETSEFMGIGKYNKNSLEWDWIGGSVDSINNIITVEGISTFSNFVLFRRIFGDVNADGYVDISDFQRLGDVWGNTSQSEFSEGSDERFFNYHKGSSKSQIIDQNDLDVFESCWHNGKSPNSEGESSNTAISIDFNYAIAGNQNQNSISQPGTKNDIFLEVHFSLAANLDTYEFELYYPNSDLDFIEASEDNPFSGENNFLKKNSGSTMGWNVIDHGTHLTIRNSLIGNLGWDTPDGDGLLAFIKFRTKVNHPRNLTFGNVDWYDHNYVHFICTNKGNGYLPVELSMFNISVEENKILLEWQTDSETNNYGFDIERLNKNETWKKIGFVKGGGTSSKINKYTFFDQIVEAGTYYYRLKQIDIVGSVYYSDIVEIDYKIPKDFLLAQNYPNPFNSNTQINFQIPIDSYVEVKIYNLKGQEVKNLFSKKIEKGFHAIDWDGKNNNGSQVTSGMYIYRLTAGSFKNYKKMIIME